MNTIKNCHSPAGMSFVANRSRVTDIDCPACKYGTLLPFEHTDRKWFRCIDCHHIYSLSLLIKLKVLPKGFV